MLAQMGEPLDSPRMKAALQWLEKEQEAEGSWFGRWGVNYVYGTWSVLCALGRAGLASDHPMVERGGLAEGGPELDGGWGESCDSYALDRKGHESFGSTASQTAWALLGLMAVGEAQSPEVARGIAWLMAAQESDGLWGQEVYTGGAARVLSALSWLSALLPLGARPVSKPGAGQCKGLSGACDRGT
jgi:squalene-hopene/tetraprenyl-beta-curcumene cyclase